MKKEKKRKQKTKLVIHLCTFKTPTLWAVMTD